MILMEKKEKSQGALCFVLFCFILLCFVLFCFVLSVLALVTAIKSLSAPNCADFAILSLENIAEI